MRIVLIGYRGTGKTTIGLHLAEKLGFDFIDTDQKIERQYGTINQIFAEKGEDYFRELERNVVKAAKLRDNCVIATGGGVVLDENNMIFLSENSFIVWLDCSNKQILQRISNSSRPPLSDLKLSDEINTLKQKRDSLYKKYSQLFVDTGNMSIAECCSKVIQHIGDLR
jgi:shikimate kinase